jgi:hypothetical protein
MVDIDGFTHDSLSRMSFNGGHSGVSDVKALAKKWLLP